MPRALVGVIWAILAFNFYDVHVRYRLTVEVQDGDQIKTGSSVIDAVYDMQPDWTWSGPHTYDPRVVGYAPTVDLDQKGLLFLTFDTTQTPFYLSARAKNVPCQFGVIGCLPFAAYDKSGIWSNASEEKSTFDDLLRQSGPRDVPITMLPKFARFRDINEPLSLTTVLPENLGATFGPGVELKRVVLQLTDDPITPPPKIWPQWLTIRHHNTMLRVCPETSGRIAEFSEHEAD
jgi:hypothetical protein